MIEAAVFESLKVAFQHDFFYIVPAALVATYLYRHRS